MIKKLLFLFSAVFLLATILAAAGAGDYAKYGAALFKKGNYKKALSYFSQAAKLEPKNPSHYKAIAECYQKLGNAALAKKYAAYANSLSRKGGSSAASKAASSGGSGKIKATLLAGFTTVSMGEVNKMITDTGANAVLAGGTSAVQNLGGGFMAGVQGGYAVIDGLYVGPRFEYVGAFSAATVITIPLLSLSETIEFSGSIINLLAGASYYFPLQGIPLTLAGDLYLGYGLATLSSNISITSTMGNMSISPAYGGGAFAAVITAGAEYKISDAISAGLSIGYRLANVAEVTANEDYAPISKGDVMNGSDGNPLPVDFSGLIISLRGDYSF